MPDQTHQAARKGLPRSETKLFATTTGALTWEHWKVLRETEHLCSQIEESALKLVTKMPYSFTAVQDNAELRSLLESEQMSELLQLLDQLQGWPTVSRPIQTFGPLEAMPFALKLNGLLLRA